LQKIMDARTMKLANPLYYPIAVLIGAIALVVGVRVANLPQGVMLPIAAITATAGATLLKSRQPETLGLENPELEQELRAVQQQSSRLATSAHTVRTEADRLLATSAQLELLGLVQYACDRASELPAKVDQLVQRMQGSDSLLSVTELQQQLQNVEIKLSASSGVAKDQLVRLADSLERNIQLARQGQDARQAQVASLSTVILDAAGMLQGLQNKLRTTDLTDVNETSELRSLSNEFKTAQETVDLLVSKS
jgi:chromosome segregation ATPase